MQTRSGALHVRNLQTNSSHYSSDALKKYVLNRKPLFTVVKEELLF